jgi:LDH2 family malate/lactate/ureidoglycolate dehydrogenase
VSEQDAGGRTVKLGALRTSLEQILEADGMSHAHAAETADVLLDAELRGYGDHGVWFLGEIHKWLRSGALNPAPNIRVLRETDSALLLDGDAGCGVAASFQAMRWCMEKAATRGLASAAIQHSGHFIAAAPFVTLAAKAGFIGICAANVVPNVVPPGGKTRAVGTNPLAFAAPTSGPFPVVFDTASSAIAGFKVRIMAQQGQTLEPNLIVDKEGQPSTDPNDLDRGGALLPFGGHRGYGIALLVEVLAGVLTGAGFGSTAGVTHGKEGHFFLAIDPGLFIPRDEVVARMDELVRFVKSGQPVAGVSEVLLPGERGQRRALEFTRDGRVPLDAVASATLAALCAETGVAVPA